MHRGPQCDSIAVYTKNKVDKSLIYEGYICPTFPVTLPVSALQPPPTELRCERKDATLQQKTSKKAGIISEDEGHRRADVCAAKSKPAKVVKAEPSTVPSCNYTADILKQQTKYPLPFEILEQGESLLPAPAKKEETDEFSYWSEPWENTVDMSILDCLCANTAPSPDHANSPNMFLWN